MHFKLQTGSENTYRGHHSIPHFGGKKTTLFYLDGLSIHQSSGKKRLISHTKDQKDIDYRLNSSSTS